MQCPLDPTKTFTSMKWTLADLREIEAHVQAARSCCSYTSLQDLVVIGSQDNERSTPLLMACKHGDLDAVKLIVEGWGVDVDSASFHYDKFHDLLSFKKMEGVTPLLVAATSCRSNIVRYLIDEKGANVNCRTSSTEKQNSGLTPLYAVVLSYAEDPCVRTAHLTKENKMSIIRFLLEAGANPNFLPDDDTPIWLVPLVHFSHVPHSIELDTLLIQWGLNMRQCCPKTGITLLHSWAREFNISDPDEESMKVVRMLVDNGADLQARDHSGLTVLLTAAYGRGWLPNFPVLDYLLERNNIPRSDKIDALELAWAGILGSDEKDKKVYLHLHYWERAQTLRLMDNEECRPIYKTPIKSRSGHLSEWNSLNDFWNPQDKHWEHCPANCTIVTCTDSSFVLKFTLIDRKIQPLLTRLRIFSGLGWEAVRQHFLHHLHHFLLKEQNKSLNISQKLDIAWIALETIFRSERPHESNLLYEVNRINRALLEILQDDDQKLKSETMEELVETMLMTDPSHMKDANLKTVVEGDHMEYLYSMVRCLSRRPKKVTKAIEKSLKRLVRSDSRIPSGLNLLQIACLKLDSEALSIVRFLLKLGADPNSVDNDGNSPLHILALKDDGETRDATARLLLAFGAHLDMTNNAGMTPAYLWLEKSYQVRENVVWNELPDWCKEGVSNLSCLSARVIRRYQVPYVEGDLPVDLHSFVSIY